MKIKKLLPKILICMLAPVICLSGCDGKVITDPDYESVAYHLNAGGGKTEISVPSEDNNAALPESGSDTASDNSSVVSDKKNSSSQAVSSNPESSVGSGQSNKTECKSKVKNSLIFSAMDSKITASKFMASLAYLDGNKVIDTLYDGIIVLPGQNFVYDTSAGGKLRPLTKNDWSSYIYNYVFKSDCNLDAADKAAGVIKDILEIPDYKVGVYLSVLYPVKDVTDWGESGGKKLDFSSGNADRISGIKWMVDEQIKAFKEKNYKNIELCGFYYYKESCTTYDLGFLPAVTDYIRKLGYITTWVPYFKAPGAVSWKDFGFDVATMQANYFPGNPTLPNAGGIDRILSAATLSRQVGLGVEMELSATNKEAVTGLKEYMRGGVKYGFMNDYHVWWMCSGPMTVKALAESGDVYIHSVYTEMYKFMKGSLQESDILIN